MIKIGGCFMCKVIGLLLIIGAINLGSIGVSEVNIIERFLGGWPYVVKIIYVFIGVAGVVALISCVKPCPCYKKA